MEPRDYVIGLQGWQQDTRRFAQWNYRTQDEGKRSGHGDLDLCVYALRKYAWLAARGNPTILILLFVEPLYATDVGLKLRGNADVFASRIAGHRYLHYLEAQRTRLTGAGGFKSTRTELVEKYGFDTKLAMHVLRLGFQGIEYLTTGRLTLPMVGADRDFCFAARQGDVTLNQVLERADYLQSELANLLNGKSPLPERPDEARINDFLTQAYEQSWG